MEENPYKYTIFCTERKETLLLQFCHVVPAHVYLLSMPMHNILYCNLKNILFPFTVDNYTEIVEVL